MDDTVNSSVKTVKGKRKNMNFIKAKKRKVVQNQITTDDLIKLEEIELTHSNLFKMQVEDLLKELKQEKEEIDLWISCFTEFVTEIPESSQCAIKDFSIGKGIKIPISLQPENDKGSFTFVAPSKVLEVGSYSLGTISSSIPVIDIAVEIPKACWQGMDNLNYRYHRKRALYLTFIAHSLLSTELASKMEFTYQNGCNIKPNLLITPKGITEFSFCLTAFPSDGSIKDSKFYPDKNNVRASWFLGDTNAVDEATPFYNYTVLVDLLLVKLNDQLKDKLSSENLREAVILLKIWALQRELTDGYGRLNGFILTSFIVSLLNKKRISAHMSSYEIFKCALLDLSAAPLKGDFFNEFMKFDALYFVNNETILMVKHEAKLALAILDNMSPDTFSYLFLKKVAFIEKFEYLMHLKNLKIDLLPKVCEKLREGLGNRILLLDVNKRVSNSWSLFSSPPSPKENTFIIGFLLNSEVPFTNLEKGPLANKPEAKVFREFWGKQSELRRFHDGSIREAVFWSASTTAEKRQVFCVMLKDIMERHFKIKRDDIIINGVETECVLHVPDIILSKDFPSYGTGEEAHVKLMHSFDYLSKQLRSLKLPLQIASIQGTSSSFRYSEVFPPLSVLHKIDLSKCYADGHIMKLKNNALGTPPYTPALKVSVQFEGSGKWPDDVVALQRVKAAFHLKIAELIKSQCSLIAIPFVTHTDIFKDGYIFRLEVACHKEIFLLKQIKSADGSIKITESKEAYNLEVSTQILPKLNGVLYGLQQLHNSYGTACRLAKRWVASQLKHGFIHDVTVELLVAFIYTHPQPYSYPCSPQVAFIRFLSLLSTHNWAGAPLIVNLNDGFKAEDIEQINAAFTSQRCTLPAMVIVTPFDKRGNMWTKNMPSELILKRIILLAEASLETLNNAFIDTEFTDIKDVFRPPLDSFDVIIHLNRKEISKLIYAVDVRTNDPLPHYSPFEQNAEELYPVVEYDPVQKYLEELKVNFGDWAVFLNDPYGGDLIAVKWKSASFKYENAKIYHGCKIIPNVEEILENFRILGDGLIKKIENKTENWQLP